MTSVNFTEFEHQLGLIDTHIKMRKLFMISEQDSKILAGRYEEDGPLMRYSTSGCTVHVAVRDQEGKITTLNAWFETREEAQESEQACIDLCWVKASG